MSIKLLSIITPVYNGRDHILNLWKSIEKQDFTNILVEWVIIEDGSTQKIDKSFIQALGQNPNLMIKYFYKENGGKHSAINFGLERIKSDYFIVVDIDDILSEQFLIYVKNILATNENFILVDKKIENQKMHEMSTFENVDLMRFYYKKRVELMPVVKFCKNLPKLPEFKNENRFPELFWFDKLSSYFNGNKVHLGVGILICKYYPDGITLNFKKNLLANKKGFLLYYFELLKHFRFYEPHFWFFIFRVIYLKFSRK